jgi:hypothetical protein
MPRLLRLAPAAVCLALAGAASGQTLTVSFDIKPTSCPNPFNPPHLLLTERFPTAILGTPDLDVRTLNAGSLVLVVPGGGGFGDTNVYPTQTGFEDVATPVADPSRCQCTEAGPDGDEDLTIKFDADDINDALGAVWGGQRIHLCIEGTTLEGAPFRGCDCIVIVGPVSTEGASWGRTKATYR